MKRRADSASRRSCSAVEPARSANTIVTTLRALDATRGEGLRGWPLARDPEPPDAVTPCIAAPHSRQNFAAGGSSVPQLAQRGAIGVAALEAELRPLGVLVAAASQVMEAAPLTDERRVPARNRVAV